MKSSRLLPWVGWDAGRMSFALFERENCNRVPLYRIPANGDSFVEVTKLWWERFAAANNWASAAELGKVCSQKRAQLSYGWENWAWALHKQGKTAQAYKILSPILKKLKIPGPPSGRGAYCLACFCGVLGRQREGERWLRLAYALAADQDSFRLQAILEPDLRSIWPGLPDLSREALSLLE